MKSMSIKALALGALMVSGGVFASSPVDAAAQQAMTLAKQKVTMDEASAKAKLWADAEAEIATESYLKDKGQIIAAPSIGYGDRLKRALGFGWLFSSDYENGAKHANAYRAGTLTDEARNALPAGERIETLRALGQSVYPWNSASQYGSDLWRHAKTTSWTQLGLEAAATAVVVYGTYRVAKWAKNRYWDAQPTSTPSAR